MKLEQAARQALEALTMWKQFTDDTIRPAHKPTTEAIAALRKALAEQAEQEPIGMIIGGRLESLVGEYETGAWPIYAAPVQQAEQRSDSEQMEPVAWVDLTGAEIGEVWAKHPRDFDKCVAIIEKFKEKNNNPVTAKEEPVATMEVFSGWWGKEANFDYLNYDLPDGFYKLYAAPVRTKDLTDDDKANLVMEHLGFYSLTGGKMSIYEAFLLGVEKGIAADREKNK